MSRKTIGYADFVEFFQVCGDPEKWDENLAVREDGVYVIPPPKEALITASERAQLSRHPSNDLSKPALAFPCSLRDLREFMWFYGISQLAGGIFFIDRLLEGDTARLAPSKRTESTDLRIIGALLVLMLGRTASGKRASVYETQTAIVDALMAHNPDRAGFSKRTLETRFADARRAD